MKLVSFSVTNYRSITTAHKINLQNATVLVGKNNEGKSNLLTALSIAMTSMMEQAGRHSPRFINSRRHSLYLWERDFPIQFQGRKSGLESIFRLNFLLEGEEQQDFIKQTGLRCNELIPIEIKYGRDATPRFSVPKRGSGSFNTKSEEVIAFICSHISFNYIQAVRTDKMALEVIEGIIYKELYRLSGNEDYKKALDVINSFHTEIYNGISERIINPLKEFLPQLQSIKIIEHYSRMPYDHHYKDLDVIIDDGTPTSIVNKGDGIKSLLTLALLKEVQSTGASIIAIEEPESHLHPEAIHSLVRVINGIAEHHQVIISTHNPLFVQRNNVDQNIIINGGMAKPAKSIKEIRDILGVLPEDNLINASYVLVVEGDDDRIALRKILSSLSSVIKEALAKNTFVIESLAGASNLSYELSRLNAYLCKYFVYLDHDDAGREAAQKAIDKGLLNEANVKFATCNGQTQSEIEDCYNPDFYREIIANQFSITPEDRSFRGNKKWSDRMKEVFNNQGQTWNSNIEKKVKLIIANAVPESKADSILNEHKRGSIDALVQAIEKMLVDIR